ncbi:isoprenylcysteine carboxylmethyltransferase family protein [bacterium]|nr:isoprenylcysteine carboxylmethyltransferase family protein [bacterium]MBU1884525.1 isoprenylcysteine carboxylmethyltransferase family protein [bacterium]
MKSHILVIIQFSTIFLMLLPLGGDITHLYAGTVLIALGLVIGIAALYKNRLGNFNIRPDIKEGGVFVNEGIYHYIRHPMYTSVLTGMFGVLVAYANIYAAVLYLILFINLLVKMFYEESLWHCKDERYKEYVQNTHRLIPYIYFRGFI